MTREERNREISQIREPWKTLPPLADDGDITSHDASPLGAWFRVSIYAEGDIPRWHERDWHSDANWPTLYREMPMPALNRRHDNLWRVTWDWEGTHGLVAERPEDGVCEAWLKWKQPALGKGAESHD